MNVGFHSRLNLYVMENSAKSDCIIQLVFPIPGVSCNTNWRCAQWRQGPARPLLRSLHPEWGQVSFTKTKPRMGWLEVELQSADAGE